MQSPHCPGPGILTTIRVPHCFLYDNLDLLCTECVHRHTQSGAAAQGLVQVLKEGGEVGLLVYQAELFPDLVPLGLHGS